MSESKSKNIKRKGQRACAQVARVVELALQADICDERLNRLWVLEVSPNPNLSNLLVTLVAPEGTDLKLATELAYKASGHFREEIAKMMNKRRTPTLSFAVIPNAGVKYES